MCGHLFSVGEKLAMKTSTYLLLYTVYLFLKMNFFLIGKKV